jgi:hypothetical protein
MDIQDKIRYGNEIGVKYMGECICLEECYKLFNVNLFKKGNIYDYYTFSNKIWVDDNYKKMGMWINNDIFEKYFVTDIKEIRKYKIKKIKSSIKSLWKGIKK